MAAGWNRLGLHLLFFLGFAVVFYRVFPQFLAQNHDAQNVYFTVTKGLEWRDSLLDVYAFSPLGAAGTTFWPFTFPLIPYLGIFGVAEDPTARFYLMQVLAASLLFGSSLFFYLATGARERDAVAASWISFVLVMLYGLAHVSAPENLQVTIWLYIALGGLALLGTGSRHACLAWFAVFELAMFGFVLSVPAWHIVAFPVLGCTAFALLWFADSYRQRAWRLSALVLALGIQLWLRTYEALFYTVMDTARVALRTEFPEVPHYQGISGHMLNNTFTDLLVGALLLIGLGWARLHESRSGAARAVHAATVAIYAGLIGTGLFFYHTSGPWPLPWPKYMVMFAFPLTALFVLKGFQALREFRPRDRRAVNAYVLLGLYFGWHIANFPRTAITVAGVLILCVVFAVLRKGTAKLAGAALLGTALLVGCMRNVDAAFGSGSDKRFDGRLRGGIVSSPVIAYLSARVGLVPGAEFRGSIEDVYSRPPESKELIDHIIGHWGVNWMTYGNGHKLFAWNVMGIPTLSEYNQYTRPAFFLLYTRLLNEPADQQVFNYLTATRADGRILPMLGVRYIVTNRADEVVPGTSQVFAWDKFRIIELDSPNVGSYSPIRTVIAPTAEVALKYLSDPAFDLRGAAIVHDAGLNTQGLVQVSSSRLVFEHGGYWLSARSAGRSLLLLPVQFSHCFEPVNSVGAKLLRANLALTGVLFSGELDMRVRYRRWPLAPVECQERDYEDTRRLLGRQ